MEHFQLSTYGEDIGTYWGKAARNPFYWERLVGFCEKEALVD
jgi:hypothetical protein